MAAWPYSCGTPEAGLVAEAEITLRHRIVLVRRAAKPLHRLLVILLHALAGLVADAEIALRLRVAFLGGLAHLLKRLPCAAIH